MDYVKFAIHQQFLLFSVSLSVFFVLFFGIRTALLVFRTFCTIFDCFRQFSTGFLHFSILFCVFLCILILICFRVERVLGFGCVFTISLKTNVFEIYVCPKMWIQK